MKGLLRKDFYLASKYGRIFLLYVLFMAGSSYFSESGVNSSYMGAIITALCVSVCMSSFSYDSLAKWDRYAASLPLDRKTVVAEKYLFGLLLTFAGGSLAVLVSAVVPLMKGEAFSWLAPANSFAGTAGGAVFALAVLLPLIFKFGVEKGRIAMFLVFAGVTAAVAVLSAMGGRLPAVANGPLLLAAIVAALILLLILSFYLSVRIYKKKEL